MRGEKGKNSQGGNWRTSWSIPHCVEGKGGCWHCGYWGERVLLLPLSLLLCRLQLFHSTKPPYAGQKAAAWTWGRTGASTGGLSGASPAASDIWSPACCCGWCPTGKQARLPVAGHLLLLPGGSRGGPKWNPGLWVPAPIPRGLCLWRNEHSSKAESKTRSQLHPWPTDHHTLVRTERRIFNKQPSASVLPLPYEQGWEAGPVGLLTAWAACADRQL